MSSGKKGSRPGGSKQPPDTSDEQGSPSRPFSLPLGYYDYYGIPLPKGAVQAKRSLYPGRSIPLGYLEHYGIVRPETSDQESSSLAQGQRLADASAASASVQAQSDACAPKSEAEQVHAAAALGTSGASGALPHRDEIQKSFGKHDVSHVKAHTDDKAAKGAGAMGAEAFTTEAHVAFAGAPTLHTAAHEAAHVIQQRAGINLKGGVGEAGDGYEQHADRVADLVVQRRSSEALLDELTGPSKALDGPPANRPGQSEAPPPSQGRSRLTLEDLALAEVATGTAPESAARRETPPSQGRSRLKLEDLAWQAARKPSESANATIQRKEGPNDTKVLDNQAGLKNTDVEIPALEGVLLAGRLEAVKKGLLSKEAFDAGLALSRRMTQLQPAVKAKASIDANLQAQAATAAQQLFAALQKETADDKNWKLDPMVSDTSMSLENPYTGESKVTTFFLFWATTHNFDGWLKRLPDAIRAGKWDDAFTGYHRLMDGLDRWVADRLRSKGKGTPEEQKGNAQQHFSQLRTGLESIAADKHATRLPALFHPDPEAIQKEKSAGRVAPDTVPMNVYFWKDPSDGKTHVYDLTTPGRPHEQPIDGAPTAAAMNTFFEEVARYPKGEVRYQLPSGTIGVAATSGKTKWYEWLGYAGLLIAGAGLALLTGGASVAATVCFAAGALAGGISAGGHLVDTTTLGTATTATVVLDVAQVAASFASFGAVGITLKAGSASAALANSRYFVPLLTTAAGADVVQLVALTDIAYTDLQKIKSSGGSPEDQQRAMAVLLTQLIVMGGLTALSVQGARNARALSGKKLELIESDKGLTLRIQGEGVGGVKLPPETLKKEATEALQRVANRIKNEAKFKLTYTLEEAEAIVKKGKELHLDQHQIDDLIFVGSRSEKPIAAASLIQQMENAVNVVLPRGYPYRFLSKEQFGAFKAELLAAIEGANLPTNKVVVQGSCLRNPAAKDIDVAIFLDEASFDKKAVEFFSGKVKMGNKAIDLASKSPEELRSLASEILGGGSKDYNAMARTFANAVKTGKIRPEDVPGFKARIRTLENQYGEMDVSVMKSGSGFELEPAIKIEKEN